MRPVAADAPAGGEPRRVDVLLAGHGDVGQAFLQALDRRRDALLNRGLDVRVTAVLRRRKVARDPAGLIPGSTPDWSARRADGLPEVEADVLVEATPTDLETGEPGLTHVRQALDRGLDVVTANKAPVALAHDAVVARARARGAHLRYGAAVAGAVPALAALRRGLAGDRIRRVEAVLNGTTTFVLSRIEEGLALEEAVDEARERGYAEADPEADLSGRDAAAKAVVLANALLPGSAALDEATIRGIRGLDPQVVRASADEGTPLRLVADALPGGTVEVAPRRVPEESPLAVDGARNALRVTADLAGTVTLAGSGAGGRATAAALLGDLVTVAEAEAPRRTAAPTPEHG